MKHVTAALLAASLFAAPAMAQTIERPAIADIAALPDEEKTDYFILASVHLAGMEGATPDAVAPVLERLEAWAPDVIAVERMPARVIEGLKGDPAHSETMEGFVGELLTFGETMQEALGLTAFEAEDQIEEWTGAPASLPLDEAATRLKTAIAAYQPETALLYWPLLGEGQIAALPPELRTFLDETEASSNERVLLAVALARTLGHAQIWPVDSQADKDLFLRYLPDIQKGFETLPAEAMPTAKPYFETMTTLQDEGVDTGNLLPLYRYLNAPDFNMADVEGQFDVFNRYDFPAPAGRIRQAAWDERNFAIAGNLRRASAFAPGGKVLLIIGAGHKPFLDELMAVGLDVKVSQDVLGTWSAPR